MARCSSECWVVFCLVHVTLLVWCDVFSSAPRFEAALEVLRNAGHKIGSASVVHGAVCIDVDGTPRTFDEIYDLADEYVKKRRA